MYYIDVRRLQNEDLLVFLWDFVGIFKIWIKNRKFKLTQNPHLIHRTTSGLVFHSTLDRHPYDHVHDNSTIGHNMALSYKSCTWL